MFVVVTMMGAVVIALAWLCNDTPGCKGHEAGQKAALDEDSYIFHVFSSVFIKHRQANPA
jgi:hypothetical protein